jgi:hypothetical protein
MWLIQRHYTIRKSFFYTVPVGTEALLLQWDEFLYHLSIEFSVLFLKPSFHCCLHIAMSFSFPYVASELETNEATSGRPRFQECRFIILS